MKIKQVIEELKTETDNTLNSINGLNTRITNIYLNNSIKLFKNKVNITMNF